MKCCLKQKLATKHRPISKEGFIRRMAYEYRVIMRCCLKKYVIPNIPYLFILWACLKLGTAYRLAPGVDFAHKLMGLGQSIGPAFADFAPGLHPLDWLIGIVGAVGFRLLIYMKSKNAKKFRRDEEYGSARCGA